MNIHPLFVHFPIALLVLYTFIEIAYPYIQRKIPAMRETRLFVLLAGWLSLLPTLFTGDMAAHIVGETELIETHEKMAITVALVFTLIAGAYTLKLLRGSKLLAYIANLHPLLNKMVALKQKVAAFILQRYIVVPLAILGLLLITVTGALGASIVYGPNIDPIVGFIYGLFF